MSDIKSRYDDIAWVSYWVSLDSFNDLNQIGPQDLLKMVAHLPQVSAIKMG